METDSLCYEDRFKICSSPSIETAIGRCLQYIQPDIPADAMALLFT